MLQLQGHVPSLQNKKFSVPSEGLVSAQVDQEFAQFLEQRLETFDVRLRSKWSLQTTQVWDHKEVLRGEVSATFVSFAVCAE